MKDKDAFSGLLDRVSALESALDDLRDEVRQALRSNLNIAPPTLPEAVSTMNGENANTPSLDYASHTSGGSDISSLGGDNSEDATIHQHQFAESFPSIPAVAQLSSQTPSTHRVTPKWRWFHLSSIVALSPEVVRNYVSTKLENPSVKCYRLTPQGSKTFEVGVPYASGQQLFRKSFWPIGTRVRDFHVCEDFRTRPNTTHIT